MRPYADAPRDYDHRLVELMHAERIACVRCNQVFEQDDRVSACPNSADGSHALVPRMDR
jgi:hypothetical protein